MRTAARLLALATLALGLMPSDLHACAVCFDAKDASRAAFLATTVFMSLLPLGMAAGVVLWLRRRQREVEREGR